jgi:glycosyltransferase involved in cell wall biosynthesis|tara:strand:- start:40486 stop:41184 length:699 start_codon:yes stop_codon:yes gene_type:complete
MDESKNKISVIMSCFNSGDTVSSAIESILQQTYKNFEFLIMDDASTDNTLELLRDYKNIDSRIQIFKNTSNIGLTKSLNFLIQKTSGAYIARQDADDLSYNERLKTQIKFLENSDFVAHTTRAKITNSHRTVPRLSLLLPKKLIIRFRNPYIHGTLLIEKNILNKIGNYNEHFYFAQDYKLFWDLNKAGYKVKNSFLTLYELNMENNISNKYKSEQQYFAECVKKETTPKKH